MPKGFKEEIELRRKIFRGLLALFGIVAIFSILTTYIVTYLNARNEVSYDEIALKKICDNMESALDTNRPDPFKVAGMYDDAEEDWSGFIYAVVNRESGEIITPDTFNDRIRTATFEEGKNITSFKENGKKYFAICCDMQKYPYRVVYICSYKYAFLFTDRAILCFIISFFLFIAILMIVIWFYILPKAQRTIRAKRETERELSQASKLQQMAITREFPKDPRVESFGFLKAAREVGGDLYGCVIKDNDFYFIIGDVSDKGAQAALVMFLLSSLSYPMMKNGETIQRIAAKLNDVLCDNSNYDMFCTAIVGKINLDTRKMSIVNAGHTRMLIGEKYFSADCNLPLGIVKDFEYKVNTLTLEPGTHLLAYTDGVTESRSEDRGLYGEARLLEWWKKSGAGSPEETCRGLDSELELWRGNAAQSDDIAALSIIIK